ncbi:hypothetical protein BDW60DRAFT_190621 [Aspergillus nidulans var. acristatus]|jgi:hypothetical protein
MSREQLLARPKSRLEELPAELIQEIFLRCLEINLARASIYLARALSNPIIYTWLVQLAFVKADGEGGTSLTRDFVASYDVVGHIERDELKKLRTRILECRWCTLPLIRSCQLAFLNHVVKYQRRDFDIIPEDRSLLAGFARRFDDLKACDKAPNGQRGQADLVLRANRSDREFDGSDSKRSHDYNIAVWFHLGIIEVLPAGDSKPSGKIYFELPCCEDAHLPDKLLCPPWTEEKLEFLQLISTRAFLDRDTEFRRATRTLRRLIRDRDLDTFTRLLHIYVRIECYGFPIIWPTNIVVFRAALKCADGPGDPFVRLLAEERWGHIEPEDILLKEKLLKSLQGGDCS